MSIKDHLYENWKQVYVLPPGPERDANMRGIKALSKGNLYWLVCRLIGGVPSQGKEFIEECILKGEMLPPSNYIRKKRYEDSKRKDQQHS